MASELRVALDLRWLQQAYRNAAAGGLGGIAVFSRYLWSGLSEIPDGVALVAILDEGDVPPPLATLLEHAPRARVVHLAGRPRSLSEARGSQRLIKRFVENELTPWNGVRRLDIDVLHRLDHVPPPRRSPFATVATIYDLTAFDAPRAGLPLRQRMLMGCERAMFALNARADAIAAISHATAHRLTAHFPDLADRTEVIFIGVPPADTEPGTHSPPPRRPSPYFLHVGVLTATKNPEGLLEGFARYVGQRGRSVRLVCAGPYTARPDTVRTIRQLAQRLQVDDLVDIADEVSDAELRDLYRGAIALVFPSFSEGFGLPLVEALGLGTPCVAADIPGSREAAGALGVYVDPASADSIAEGMVRASDPDHGHRVAELGRAWAQQFSVAGMAARYLDVYRRAFERRRIRVQRG